MNKHSIADHLVSFTGVTIGAVEYMIKNGASLINFSAATIIDVPSLINYFLHCVIAGSTSLFIKKAFDLLSALAQKKNGKIEKK